MKKIVFFVQTKKPIGGSQIQFLDFAAYIGENYNYETYYINYSNPKLQEKYGEKVRFLDVDQCDYTQFEDAVFFTPVNYLFYLLSKIKELKRARIALYFYHPNVFDWLNAQIYIPHRKSEELLKLICDTNSYCFMDSSNYLSIKRTTNVPFSPIYLPVTLHYEDKYVIENSGECQKDKISIGWLGRLDGDKIYSIVNVADNLVKDNTLQKPIDFHIIGDGNSKNKISIKEYSPNIRFIFTSYLYSQDLKDYIAANVDLVIAMGISAIESSMLDVPTVIPIVSSKRFWSNFFVYIQDINDYSLGWNINDLKELGCQTYTIQEILETVYKQGMKQKIGTEARSFCESHFAIKNAAERLIDILETTELTVAKCLETRSIIVQLRDFCLYKKLKPNNDYPMFHEFVAKLNRVKRQKFKNRLIFFLKLIKKKR